MKGNVSKVLPLTVSLSAFLLFGCAESQHAQDHAHDRAHSHGSAEFIAHAAVMVESGSTKILFDPIFDKDYGSFQLVAPETQSLMMAGQPPFEGVDAVFVSHAHGDHFAAGIMIDYLTSNPDVQLVAPTQALTQMQDQAEWNAGLTTRIHADALALNESVDKTIDFDGTPVAVTGLRFPHAGGERHAKIENIIYRVSLSPDATVMHLGDADPAQEGLKAHANLFNEKASDMAFVPFWFVGTANDPAVNAALNAEHVVGVHVPKTIPEALAASGADYFSTPGETREIVK